MDTTVLQFYNITTKETLVPFLEKWFEEQGRGVTHGKFHTPTRSMERFQSYWYVKRKMDLLKDIRFLHLVSRRAGGSTDISVEIDWDKKVLDLSWARSRVGTSSDNTRSLIESLLIHTDVGYGACFDIDMAQHIKDLRGGEENKKEGTIRKMMKWNSSYASKQYREDSIRGIFPLNILSTKHLREPLGLTTGVLTLEGWIKKEKGELLPLGEGLSLWKVSDPTPPMVERTLENAFPKGFF